MISEMAIENVSQYKTEYLDMTVNALVDGVIRDIQLAEYKGKFFLLLFYQSDFSQLIREEFLEMIDLMEKFEKINCQVSLNLNSRFFKF